MIQQQTQELLREMGTDVPDEANDVIAKYTSQMMALSFSSERIEETRLNAAPG